MALQKQSAPINFSGGLDTKTDPFQVKPGKFLSLLNIIRSKGGRLQKRNGYKALASLPNSSSLFITTFNGDLTALGTTLSAYSSSSSSWVNRGSIQPVDLSVLPMIRNNLNQTQADSVVSGNGLVCTAYTETDGVTNTYKYAVADSSTGQNIVAPTSISTADATYGTPKVFLLGNYFIIVFTNKVSSTYHLQFFAISTANPSTVTTPADISTSYTPSTTVAFDGATLNGSLYLAWNGAAASGVKMAYINSTLSVSSAINPDSTRVATVMSVCADSTTNAVWATYYDAAATTTYAVAVSSQLVRLTHFPHQVLTNGFAVVQNIASVASAGTMTCFFEGLSSASGVPANFVFYTAVTQSSGSVLSPATIVYSVGLASKAFYVGSAIYMLVAYGSSYQPTYFLINSSGSVLAKLAYQNGGGYLTTGLPSAVVSGTTVNIAYQFKDLIEAVNKNTNPPSGSQTAGIYSQTGINLVTMDVGTSKITAAEIGSNLNVSGGFLWAYDGYSPVEQGFFLYPEYVQGTWTETSTKTPTGDVATGSRTLSNVSSVTGVAPGMTITGTAIPAGTTILSVVDAATLLMSAAATGTHATETVTIQGHISGQPDSATNTKAYWYQFTYEWSDNQGNIFRSAPSIPISITTTGAGAVGIVTLIVPTLRLTHKTANAVKIVGYRWSVAQQSYYQVTSITLPTLNSTTSDSVTFVDTLSDASILGNNLIYTTGGVLENTGSPACSSTFLFDDRLFTIDSEDRNLLVFSKQVVEGSPVEMSDLLTKYIAPNVGAQGPSGPLTCGFPMDDKAILFKNSSLLYFNGSGPDNTGSNDQYSQPSLINSSVGCSNQNSIVFMPSGLMFEFQSEAGNQIWLLGRDLSTRYIGDAVEEFTLNSTVDSAVNIPGTNQVRFTLSSGVTLMFDYYYGEWSTFSNVAASSSTIFQGLHTYLNSSGSVYQENPGSYVDGSRPVLMGLTSSWFNLAGLQGYQRAYYFFLLAEYLSPHKINVQIAYDYNSSPSQSFVISPDNFGGTYGDDETYGDSETYGGPDPLEQWRCSFIQQKCEAFQLTMTEIYDPSFGVAPGAGFTLSGINLIFGAKKSYPRLAASRQTG